MNFGRRILVLLAALTSLIGANVILSAPAHAATSCSGAVTYRKAVSYPGDGVVGELVIYYNSTNGGTNSACFYHRGVSSGVSAETYVYIMRCSQKSGEGQRCKIAAPGGSDWGKFAHYAGPVGVTGTAKYCVAAIGWIVWRGVEIGDQAATTQGC